MEYSNSDVSDNEMKICSKCQQFYGTKATSFMCSKCFKESTSSMKKNDDKFGLMMNSSITQNTLCDLGFTKAELTKKSIEVQQVKDVEMDLGEEQKFSEIKDISQVVEKFTEGEKTKKPAKNRCHMCNKKTGLLGFECKCGYSFCSKHRHGDDHNCEFDYMGESRAKLEKQNPIVSHSKVGRI